MKPHNPNPIGSVPNLISRRDFARGMISTAMVAAIPSIASTLAAKNPDKVKIGLIGCGNRGVGALMDAVIATPNVEIYALADLFPEQIEAALTKLKTSQKEINRTDAGQYGNLVVEWTHFDAVNVTRERCFTGFDAYKQLLQTDVDIVILATPPGFRPLHIRAALEAGKHVFAEKPVAVDPVGVRSVFESVELARKKKLGLMGGTQLRFHRAYREIMGRVLDGKLGPIMSADCYWWAAFYLGWHMPERKAEWSDMEYQIRSWPHFCWLSGDHIVENLVHNIDIMNWAMGGPPKTAVGQGGHANWEDWATKGDIFDHFYIEFEYPNGVHASASSRQNKNCTSRIGERIVCGKGIAYPYARIEGESKYEFPGPFDNPRMILWSEFIDSIRQGEPLNHGKEVAESTMTAILGRMSAYTGRAMNYSWALNQSKLDLSPPAYAFGPLPPVAVPVPGRTPVV